jgi:hypothetical protein
MVGVPVGLKVASTRCTLSNLAVDPLFPWGLRVLSSDGDVLTAAVELLLDGQRLHARRPAKFTCSVRRTAVNGTWRGSDHER